MFFVGDSAGHCLPLSAEGIRTAFYFGIAAGRELAAVLGGAQSHDEALRRYSAFSAAHGWKFAWMKRWQDNVWRLRPRTAGRARPLADLAAARRVGVRALPAGRAARVRAARAAARRGAPRRPTSPRELQLGSHACAIRLRPRRRCP